MTGFVRDGLVCILVSTYFQEHMLRQEKEHKPKLFGPDFFGWGRALPREGVGAEKFGMSFETQETKLFGRDIPGFCRDIPGMPKKFEKKRFGFNFRSPIKPWFSAV